MAEGPLSSTCEGVEPGLLKPLSPGLFGMGWGLTVVLLESPESPLLFLLQYRTAPKTVSPIIPIPKIARSAIAYVGMLRRGVGES